MTACCWPQEQGLTAHTLACVLATPDLYVTGGPNDPTTRAALRGMTPTEESDQ